MPSTRTAVEIRTLQTWRESHSQNRRTPRPSAWAFVGGAEEIRTPDPLHAMEVRYQLRHSPASSPVARVCGPPVKLVESSPEQGVDSKSGPPARPAGSDEGWLPTRPRPDQPEGVGSTGHGGPACLDLIARASCLRARGTRLPSGRSWSHSPTAPSEPVETKVRRSGHASASDQQKQPRNARPGQCREG